MKGDPVKQPLLLSDKNYFLSPEGKHVNADFLLGKVICLLFGAAWSPPFVEFCQTLKTFYNELQEDSAPVEVVYVSFDRSKTEMMNLSADFPKNWVSVPFGHILVKYLKLKYDIVVIPKLIVVKDDGEIVTSLGVKDIKKHGKRCFTSWYKTANDGNQNC